MRTGQRWAATVARVAGRVVAVPLGAVARWRGGKPMHPRGVVLDAVLERHGSTVPWGVPWLDDPATEAALVRLSRGAGLPAPLPDLLGLAVRVPGGTEPVDLLLSTTGSGPLTRMLPVLRRDGAAVHSSIMGYRSAAGTLRLAAFPEAGQLLSEPRPLADEVARRDRCFTLAAARGGGSWQPFARLRLTAPRPPLDPDVAFDAVRHPPPGLVPDGPLAGFRAPAYARARAARRSASGAEGPGS
ncbi:phosphodiesterase [Blastococcus tunisiensis]|uniref:Phosphodiesterase n=1 Tax=Blastococcus tunisiensis TaxID=1798228 RepID=A0A1I2JX25_9ACTN|nr:phosphodiesterase [Blastococcus sp. DSM 46838]SFF57306.1 hypothetical protein SAMN05216574_11784 [Blastococcus sp. DSM 46838]